MSFDSSSFELDGFLRLDASNYTQEVNEAEQETEGLQQAAQDTEQTLDRSLGERLTAVGDTAKATGLKLSAGLTAPLGALGFSAVQAASRAEEAQARFNSIFTETGTEVEQFADRFAEEIGRSSLAIEQAAADFGSLLNPMIDNEEQVADLSKEFVKLTQDLASFENRDPAQVQRDLQSALSGQSETVRKYGVDLSAARVDQELLNMGIKGGREEATRAQEAQARLNAILEDTQSAQGNAAETADSFANQQRALRAAFRDFRVELGEELLPVAKTLVSDLKGLVGVFDTLDDSTQRTVAVAGAVAAALGPILLVVGQLITSIGALSGAFGLLLGPIGVLAATAAALGFAFREELAAGLERLPEVLQTQVLPAVRGLAQDAMPMLRSFAGALTDVGLVAIEALRPVAETVRQDVIPALTQAARESIPVLVDIADALIEGFQDAVELVLPAVQDLAEFVASKVVPALMTFGEDAVPVVASATETAAGVFDDFIDVLVPATDQFIDALVPAVLEFARAALPVVSRELNRFASFVEAVLPVLQEIAQQAIRVGQVVLTQLVPAVQDIVQTLSVWADVLGDATGRLKAVLLPTVSFARALTDTLEPAFGPTIAIIETFVKMIGDNIVTAVRLAGDAVEGITALLRGDFDTAISAVNSAVGRLGSAIATFVSDALDTLSGFVPDAVGAFGQFVTDSLSAVGSFGVDLATKLGTVPAKVTDAAAGIADSIVGAIEDGLSSAVEAGSEFVTGLVGFAGSIIDGIASAIAGGGSGGDGEGGGSSITDSIISLITSAIPAPARVISEVASVGKAIVDGIVSGIKSAPGAIADALGDVLPSLPNVDLGLGGSGGPEVPDAGDAIGPGVGGGTGGGGGNLGRIGLLPGVASGGRIAESGLAMLHRGEEVVPAATVTDRGEVSAGGTTIETIEVYATTRQEGREAATALKTELRREGFDL